MIIPEYIPAKDFHTEEMEQQIQQILFRYQEQNPMDGKQFASSLLNIAENVHRYIRKDVFLFLLNGEFPQGDGNWLGDFQGIVCSLILEDATPNWFSLFYEMRKQGMAFLSLLKTTFEQKVSVDKIRNLCETSQSVSELQEKIKSVLKKRAESQEGILSFFKNEAEENEKRYQECIDAASAAFRVVMELSKAIEKQPASVTAASSDELVEIKKLVEEQKEDFENTLQRVVAELKEEHQQFLSGTFSESVSNHNSERKISKEILPEWKAEKGTVIEEDTEIPLEELGMAWEQEEPGENLEDYSTGFVSMEEINMEAEPKENGGLKDKKQQKEEELLPEPKEIKRQKKGFMVQIKKKQNHLQKWKFARLDKKEQKKELQKMIVMAKYDMQTIFWIKQVMDGESYRLLYEMLLREATPEEFERLAALTNR